MMKRLFGISRRFGVVVLAAALGGCAGSTIDSAVPTAGGPVNTGQFPNLNIPAQAAAPQFTPEEREAGLASLQAAQQRQSGGPGRPPPRARGGGPGAGVPPAEVQRLKKLAQGHADEALKEIEGQ